MKYKSNSEKETQKIAKELAGKLHGGELILLYGDLGAGKSVFVRALAEAMGIKEKVKSPTFNLMKCYKIKKGQMSNVKCQMLHFCHIDAYRLSSLEDLLDIGADEYIGKENCITAIEWAEKVKEIEKMFIKSNNHKIIKSKIIKVKIDYGAKDNEREIKILTD